MAYDFEAELITKLENYDVITSQIKLLTDQKEKIRDQVKKWRELNKISEKVTIVKENSSWIIDVYSQHRRSVRDFDMLILKLGPADSAVYIEEKDSDVLKITKR